MTPSPSSLWRSPRPRSDADASRGTRAGGRGARAGERGTRAGERGTALVISLLLTLVLSAVAGSLAFLAQSETNASVNYKLMSQARYAAESGVHKAINYLLNTYPQPGSAGDPLANYDMTKSPVTYNGVPVVLSGSSSVTSNYPLASTQTAFSNAVQGTFAAGDSVAYGATATLMSMRTISVYGSGALAVVQTWQITGMGSVTTGSTAEVDVSAVLEQQVVPAHLYAAFATASTCGAITLSGSASTDSYDSSSMTMSGGHPVTQSNSGDVGTNGNLTESGGATINGKLYTPRTGVGTCNNGGGGTAGDALQQSGSAAVTGGLVQLPQVVAYATPALPSPLPGTSSQSFSHNTGCGALANCQLPNGSGSPNILKFVGGTAASPSSFQNVSLSSDVVLHVGATSGCPCYYNFNSLVMSGAAQLVVDGGPVVINVAGQSGSPSPNQWMSSPLTLSGGGVVNATYDPSALQIQYGGTSNISMSGGTSNAAMLYAPNAAVTLSGGADFYGSILASKLTDSGGTKIHYDRHLSQDFYTTGNPMLSSFTWKKY